MKKLSHGIILLIVILCSCSQKPKESSINETFYADLYEQVNSEHFSPLEFASLQSPYDQLHTISPTEVNEEMLSLKAYSFKIHYRDGSILQIDSLMDYRIGPGHYQFSKEIRSLQFFWNPIRITQDGWFGRPKKKVWTPS